MQLREGRIGKQETASAVFLASTVSGLFAVQSAAYYRNGNSSYFSTILAALISLLLFSVILFTMAGARIPNLAALYQRGYGPVFSGPASLLTSLALSYFAALPMIRMLIVLLRNIFLESPMQNIAGYFLLSVFVLVAFGLETIGRTAKLFVGVFFLSLVAAVWLSAPSFETFRLYPLLGNGMGDAVLLGVTGINCFFPALLSLLILLRGVQGPESASASAALGGLSGGAVTGATQLCLGMVYTSPMLARMHAPLYRLTMAVRTGGVHLRTDKLLFFLWTMGGMIAGAFYTFAGALLYTEGTGMRDIRPVGAAFSLLTGGWVLLGVMNGAAFERFAEWMNAYGWLILTAPPLLGAVLTRCRRRKAT